MRVYALIGLMIACGAAPAMAQQVTTYGTDTSRTPMRGAGNDSCGKFLTATQNLGPGQSLSFRNADGREYFGSSEVYAEWIQGYISGVNITLGPNSGRQVAADYPGTDMWIRQWCQGNPAEPIAAATDAFIKNQLNPPQQQPALQNFQH